MKNLKRKRIGNFWYKKQRNRSQKSGEILGLNEDSWLETLKKDTAKKKLDYLKILCLLLQLLSPT